MKNYCFGIILVLMLALAGCSGEAAESAESVAAEQSSDEYVKELNDNSNMGMALNQDSGLTEEEAKQYGMDHPYVMNQDGKLTDYYCFCFSKADEPLTITQIDIQDVEYDVFGIHLGDNIEDSIAVLHDYGYEQKDYPVDNVYCYVKGDVNVILRYEGNAISGMVVSLDIETEDGVMY